MRIHNLIVAAGLALATICPLVNAQVATSMPPDSTSYAAAANTILQSGDKGPSLEETLAYVNSKLANGGREVVRHGRISLSDDHETISCEYIFLNQPAQLRARVIALAPSSAKWQVMDDEGRVDVFCKKEYGNCAEEIVNTNSVHLDKSQVNFIAWPYPPDDEGGMRLVKAYNHLLDLLQAEYHAKHGQNDPFAN
jgi:hypothetical protein